MAVTEPWTNGAAWTPARGRKTPLAGDSVTFLAHDPNPLPPDGLCCFTTGSTASDTLPNLRARPARPDKIRAGPGSGPGQARNLAARAANARHSGRANPWVGEARNLTVRVNGSEGRSTVTDDNALVHSRLGHAATIKIPDLGASRLAGDDDRWAWV